MDARWQRRMDEGISTWLHAWIGRLVDETDEPKDEWTSQKLNKRMHCFFNFHFQNRTPNAFSDYSSVIILRLEEGNASITNCHLELAQAITTLSVELIWPAAFKTLFRLAVSG